MRVRPVCVVVVLLADCCCCAGVAAEDAAVLPGAAVEIDAAQHPSLQHAIDALPASGGVVRLPAGVLEIDAPLVVSQDDVTLAGVGSATCIKNVNTAGEPAIVIRHPSQAEHGGNRKFELWRVRIANLRLIGNPESGHGVYAVNANELFFEGVSVSYHGGDGLRLAHCFEDPRICDSLFTYNKATGVNLIDCHDAVVDANQFEENQDGLRFIDGFNLCMNGNNLDDHLRHGVVIENTYGSVLSGNMIEECAESAVVLDRNCYGITVSANVIAHDGRGVVLNDAHGCAVSANTFTIMKNEALLVGADSGRITITGNSFSNSYIGGGQVKRRETDRLAGGLRVDGSAVAVVGNVFSGLTQQAIAGGGDERSVIDSNVFVDNAEAASE